MAQDIFGKLFGDRGYISQDLFEQLYEQQLQIDKILLRKRAITSRQSTTNSKISFKSNIQDTPCIWNFLVNLMAGLIAYTYLPNKPSLDLEPKDLLALPSATF